MDEYTAATLEQLGLTDADKAQRFFARHGAADFQWLRVAVKLPPLPAVLRRSHGPVGRRRSRRRLVRAAL